MDFSRKGDEMEMQTVLGLPLDTLIIIGGLYLLATFLPSVIAFIMKCREENK